MCPGPQFSDRDWHHGRGKPQRPTRSAGCGTGSSGGSRDLETQAAGRRVLQPATSGAAQALIQDILRQRGADPEGGESEDHEQDNCVDALPGEDEQTTNNNSGDCQGTGAQGNRPRSRSRVRTSQTQHLDCMSVPFLSDVVSCFGICRFLQTVTYPNHWSQRIGLLCSTVKHRQ